MPAPIDRKYDPGLSLVSGHATVVGSPGEGPVLRNSLAADALLTGPVNAHCENIYDLFARGAKVRPTAPCMGSRVAEDGTVGDYEWQTYLEISARVDAVAAALWKDDLVPTTADGSRFLGFFLKNCRDWMVTALACYRTGVTVVPMYDTLGADTVAYIQRQTTCATVLCSAAEIGTLLKGGGCPFATVIVTGHLDAKTEAAARAGGINIKRFAALEALGAASLPLLGSLPPPARKDVALLCYTSGTTGDPKGAMLSHGNILAAVGAAGHPAFTIFSDDPTKPQEVHISYLPLAHIFETVVINLSLFSSAAVGFYQGDTLKILDDLQALRPTVFVSVPRLYNRIFDKIQSGAKAKGGLAAALFARALGTKLANLKASGEIHHGLWDKLVFSKVQAGLGLDRCTTMVTGSAPLAGEVKDFMRVAMGVTFIEGYGLTETAAATTTSHPADLGNGHVGMPVCCAEIKLVDVPDMKYLSTNTPPKGEVCVRGPPVFLGYYKMADKTAEAFDDEGWFHTGDVGTWTSHGCLKIIDRKKNIFKLAQGEYIAAEKLEVINASCPLIAQNFVYGDSLQSYVIAVVVPDAEEVAKWAADAKLPTTDVGAIVGGPHEAALLAAVMKQIVAAAKEAKLAGFEVVKRVHLDAELWSSDNGLLTPTFKNKRNDLKAKYLPALDAMYAEGPPASRGSKL